MQTKKSSADYIVGKEILAVGYKAVKHNGKTMQGNYCYGAEDEEIVEMHRLLLKVLTNIRGKEEKK